jgi:hypothetical protein
VSAAALGVAATPEAVVNTAEVVDVAARLHLPQAEGTGQVRVAASTALQASEIAHPDGGSGQAVLWPTAADTDRVALEGGQAWQPMSTTTAVVGCHHYQQPSDRSSLAQASRSATFAPALLAGHSTRVVEEEAKSAANARIAVALQNVLLKRMQRERRGRLLQKVLNAWWRHTTGNLLALHHWVSCIDSSLSSWAAEHGKALCNFHASSKHLHDELLHCLLICQL